MKFRYTIDVDNGSGALENGGPYEARLVDSDGPGGPASSPLKSSGDTPILALAALVDVLREWPEAGADRWLATPDGEQLRNEIMLGERRRAEKARSS